MEVSIHAISGVVSLNSMKLMGKFGASQMEILMDSRSTHNFLVPLVVQTSKLKVLNDLIMQVCVANGAKVCTTSVYEEYRGISS